QAEDGIRDYKVTGVQTCALPISLGLIAALAFATTLAGVEIVSVTILVTSAASIGSIRRPSLPTSATKFLSRSVSRNACRRSAIRSEERRVGKEGRDGYVDGRCKK